MKCFYHNDMDGKCSAAIVYKFYKRDRDYETKIGAKCEFFPIDYKEDFPFESIRFGETIVIVDFSLQKKGDFDKLLEITDNVIWIDHHKTAIEKHGDLNLRGIRKDGTAACVLTYEFFYPKEPSIPTVVALLGDYDVWEFKYKDDTKCLQAGIQLYETNPEDDNWITWLNPDYSPDDIINDGKIALAYRDNYYKSLVNSIAFFTKFEGYTAIACNAGKVNSMLFDSVEGDYDIMMPFYYDGKQWTVSLYTKKDDIDVSEIAKKYGGGGHKKAAGFQCDSLVFG